MPLARPATLGCECTDGPYLLDTDMKREIDLLIAHEILDEGEVDRCLAWAREASFLEAEPGGI